ncbi:hypothetical protein MU448_11280 [Streptococcus sp. O1]|uniref:hypothetical protein n=1 Tax=Streptococcus sp. O1 TaxID=2928735 RepID=UPI00211ADA4B|nr:hypothetical protein [Streptococcus sp. O1]MCQ9213142.1 hypothetical protein [Streptococcus sp. O1]MCQ9214931.1 hypothetical protein [Streptococcus sp. O1]
MTTIASFVFIISAVSVWYHIKKKPNKKNRNISILVFLVSFIVVGVTAPNNDPKSPKVNESSYQKDSYYFNENEAKEFALYFKEHAEVIDKGNKIEFIAGADKDYVSARVGEIWKDESVNRKIYLSNELLKEKINCLKNG